MKTLFALLLLSAGVIFGQSLSSPPVVINQYGQPVANVQVTVCATNPGTGPCSILVATYTDQTLGHACTGSGAALNNLANPSVGAGCSNPGFTDGLGNVVVFASGTLWCQYSTPSIQPYTIPCGASGSLSQNGATNFAATGLPPESDAFTGVTTAPVGGGVHQFNGLSGICYTFAVSNPLGSNNNCVGVFGVGAAQVNNSAAWGANFGASALTGTSGALVIGVETDLGLVSGASPNRFQGHLITGAALAGTMPPGPVMGTIPGGSTSVAMGYGDSFPSSSTTQFPVMYYSSRGGAAIGLQLDATCYTGACNSQTIQMGANTGSAAATMTMQAFAGTPSGTCATNTLGFNASAATASTMLYVCVGGTSTWTAITVP